MKKENLNYLSKNLFFYKIKLISSYIRSLYYSNIIDLFLKKNLLKQLNLIKRNNKSNFFFLKEKFIEYNFNNKNFFFLEEKNFSILIKMFLLDEIEKIHILLIFIRKIIFSKTKEYCYSPMGIKEFSSNELITIGFFILSWNEKIKKNHINLLFCKKKISYFPIELNFYSNFKINKNIIKKMLGFKNLNENFLDSINEKNFILLFLNFCNLLMLDLSYICNEINKLNNISNNLTNFSEIKNKTNIFEFIEINISKIFSNYFNLIINLKNNFFLKKNYNEHIQEILFENIFIIKKTLYDFKNFLLLLKFNKKDIYFLTLKNFSKSDNMINYLIKKGLSYNDSIKIYENCIKYCNKYKLNFFNITLQELKKFSNYFEKDIFYQLSIEYTIKKKDNYGESSPKEVLKSLERAKFFLNNLILKFSL